MKSLRTEELPDMLTAQHIADHLNISRRTVYSLFQLNPEYGGIPSLDIGYSKRVEKSDYLAWLDARKEEKISRFKEATA